MLWNVALIFLECCSDLSALEFVKTAGCYTSKVIWWLQFLLCGTFAGDILAPWHIILALRTPCLSCCC